ncbi:uncharacterized protein SCHCODRAFT_02502522 [Schizophyllum commune H4-8]|nr:uncharacterized protein SCHCODRAFT_02502522 [Schizophyllum commune H4-8]KAI5892361.1 hypothetical protein SCHCODRAFT_02502522 [Schizophyllum commune H4-8]
MPFTSPYSPFFTSGLLIHGAPTTPASLVGTPPLSDATGYFGTVHTASSPSDVALGSSDISTRQGSETASQIGTSTRVSPHDVSGQSTLISWDCSAPSVHPSHDTLSTPKFGRTSASRAASPSTRERKRSDALAVLEGDRSRASDILVPIATPSAASSEEPYLLLSAETPETPSSPRPPPQAEGAVTQLDLKMDGLKITRQPSTSTESSFNAVGRVQLVRKRSKSVPRNRLRRRDRQLLSGDRGDREEGVLAQESLRHRQHTAIVRPAQTSLITRRARSASPYRLALSGDYVPLSFMEMQTPETEKVPQ